MTIGGVQRSFLHDGLNPVQEQTALLTANLLTGLGIDEFYVRSDAVGAETFLTDALGSAVALTGAAGTVQVTYTYEAFGTTTVAGVTVNSYDYTGRESDGTGLKYYRARYYHPVLQRFIAEDPIGFASGEANLYAYVRNAPADLRDPDGLRVLNPNNYPVSPAVLAALDKFNECIGLDRDVVITGGNRPPSSKLGAGAASPHARGLAADIVVPGQQHLLTAHQAIGSGLFGGVGWYQEGYRGPSGEGPHVHVDLRQGTSIVTWGHDRDGNYYSTLPPLAADILETLSGRKRRCGAPSIQ